MTFSGDLSGISIPDVFQNLAGNRSTGTLHVRWDKGERFVRFVEGQVAAFSYGQGKELPLLDHVAERGYADNGAIGRILANRRRRKRPARVLLDDKLCDSETIHTALREVTSEGVYELMTLSAAQFAFTAGNPPADVFDPDLIAADVRLEVGPLLLEGARRADDMQRVRTVVGSDQDLFVADPKAHERAPDELTAAVAAVLDGRTDVAGVARAVQRSRFAVSSALLTLVQQGLARPSTGEEIAALAERALAANERDDAIRLLGQALVRMPREALLRRRLAETLASAGRKREAAGELAMLAFQATEEERFQDALSHYDRAIALDPADVLLHQRRCDVLKRVGDKNALRQALLSWAHRLESLGLADRACDVLASHVDGGPLRGDLQLLQRLAELCKANGNLPAAAARYLQLVDLHGGSDPNLELRGLRAALAAQPDDPAIKRRLHDLESGRAARRRRHHRILGIGGAATVLGLGLLCTAARELAASWRLAAVLRERPADGCGSATLPALRVIAADHAWVPSGALAAAIAEEEAMRLLRAAADLRLQGRVDEALAALNAAHDSLPDAARGRADTLADQLRIERPLFDWLRRVERRGQDDSEACEALARKTGSDYFEFHKDMVGRVRSDAARLNLLRALQATEDPRAAEGVARAFLATRSNKIADMAESLLMAACRKDPQGTQESLEALLREGRDQPELRPRAERILQLVTTALAAPR